jgi:hypothetical protein
LKNEVFIQILVKVVEISGDECPLVIVHVEEGVGELVVKREHETNHSWRCLKVVIGRSPIEPSYKLYLRRHECLFVNNGLVLG